MEAYEAHNTSQKSVETTMVSIKNNQPVTHWNSTVFDIIGLSINKSPGDHQ